MHGLFLTKFQQFALHVMKPGEWVQVVVASQIQDTAFHLDQFYSDEVLIALIQAAATRTNTTPEAWQEAFGCFLAPDLIKLGQLLHLADPKWKTLDYVVNVQSMVHAPLIRLNPGMHPARLIGIRYTPRKAIMIYLSPRHWCHLAKGIILGMAEFFREPMQVTMKERRCMLTKNRKECWLFIEHQPAAALSSPTKFLESPDLLSAT